VSAVAQCCVDRDALHPENAMQSEQDFASVDDDLPFVGDLPDDSEARHAEEIEHLIWAFNAVASQGAYVAFSLSHAVGSFAGRKSKDSLSIEDAERLKSAVGAALRVAVRHAETKGLRHLRTGMAAIHESIDVWSDPAGVRVAAAPLRRLLIRILKHEVTVAYLMTIAAEHSPAAWVKSQRLAMATGG
jgi:hypothetical protein